LKKFISGLIALAMTACSGVVNGGNLDGYETEPTENSALQPEPPSNQPSLDNLGPAPELENDVWLNSDVPLRLADLRGQVVLLDMWTFG
jgi:hypothetical protein